MPSLTSALAFALVMPLTRRQALSQSVSQVPILAHGVAKRHHRCPPHKSKPGNTGNVKREPQPAKEQPLAKLEPIPSLAIKSEPALITKSEPVPAADIEDPPSPPCKPSAARSRQVTSRLHTLYRPTTTTTLSSSATSMAHPKTQPRSLLDSLVATILSQATTNVNSSRAFANLKRAFPAWDDAIAASAPAIEDAIRCGGLAKQKAVVIHGILRTLKHERGETSLEYLGDLPDHEVKAQLCRFKGVGPKTAACVLMFGMRRAEFPVDTHVRRIAGRLGWMPLGASAESTYEVLNGCVPDDIKHSLHVLLIEHGRKVCRAQRPRCSECPLADICPAAGVAKIEAKEEYE